MGRFKKQTIRQEIAYELAQCLKITKREFQILSSGMMRSLQASPFAVTLTLGFPRRGLKVHLLLELAALTRKAL